MCKVCSSLGQKWGNERAITGSKIILTSPFLKDIQKQVAYYKQITFFEAANADVINGHLFKQKVAYCKQIISFKAANKDVLINGHFLSKQLLTVSK